jgi:hypothetical protein
MGDMMPKFNLDYSKLDNKIYKKAYKLSEVQDKIEKVAFDIVRFKENDAAANLWQIQNADDGDYIIAIYNPEDTIKKSEWEVNVLKTANAVEVSYKGDPIVRVSASKLGIPPQELNQVESYLPAKLAENKKLVKSLLNELSVSAKNAVLNKYPELV